MVNIHFITGLWKNEIKNLKINGLDFVNIENIGLKK